jgi:hypothetical protein
MYRLCIPMSYDYVIYLNESVSFPEFRQLLNSTVKGAGKRIRLAPKFTEIILIDRDYSIPNMIRLFIRMFWPIFLQTYPHKI